MKEKNTARVKEKYHKEVIPSLMKNLGIENVCQVPRLEKIVVNIGVNDAKENIKVLDIAQVELAAIAGQKPKVTRAKKSISNFKLREGMPIGLTVTLRGNKMYEFLDRLISIAIPRIRDFRGLNKNSFDGKGNYNLGLREQYIFPEIDLDKSDKTRGMNITIATTASNNNEALELLKLLGMPFKM
ncbi:MAG: 50S ribosomal protein L5 [bacterium]